MDKSIDIKELELFCVIVNFGLGSKVIKIAKENGVSGGTAFLGKGTVKNTLLQFLDITDIRKEIVLLIAEKSLAYKALEELNKKLELQKSHHGIAFTTSIMSFFGARQPIFNESRKSGSEDKIMYNAIFVVVDKGLAESVIDAATSAGSKGGTIINARGSGVHENQKLFAMAIEPEKEIVMILSEAEQTDTIVTSIRKHLKIDEPGNGIIFIIDISKTYGLY